MELKVYKDSLCAAQPICDTRLELPVETEFLIPDYLAQVFKVVKCFVTPVVLQKQAAQGRVTVEGYLRCAVLYQAEGDGALCRTEQKLPFTKQVECRLGEYDPAGALIEAAGQTEYVNCRAVSGRRVEVRGAFLLHVRAWAQQSADVVSGLAGDGVYQKTQTLVSAACVAGAEKIVSVEEELGAQDDVKMLLGAACAADAAQVELLAGKAVVKSTLRADLLCRGEDAALHHVRCEIPVNEVIDVGDVPPDCRAAALLTPANCALEPAQGKMLLLMTASLVLRVWRDVQVNAVADAFSSRCTLELTPEEAALECAQEPFARRVTAVAKGQLPDAGARVLEAMATPHEVEAVEQEGKTVLRGTVTAHVLCESETGEIDCYDKMCEYTLEPAYDVPAQQLCALCSAGVLDVAAQKSGDEVQAQVTLAVNGFASCVRACAALGNAQEAGARENGGDIALHVYFAQKGEEVFDIAKRYGAPPSAVLGANGLEEDTLGGAQRLLIPHGD